MSRAAWLAVLCLGGGLGLIAFLLTRGLPDDALRAAEAAREAVTRSESDLAEARQGFEAAVAEDRAFLAALPEIKAAEADLTRRAEALAAAKKNIDARLEPLLADDDHGDAAKVIEASRAISTEAAAAIAGATASAGVARTLLGYKQDHDRILQTAREQVAAAERAAADPTLQSRVDLAATRYPEARDALAKRQRAITDHAAQLARAGATLEQHAARAPPAYLDVGKAAEAIGQGHDKLQKMQADLDADIATLGKSIDRILVDMKRDGGKYWHKYKIVENGVERTTDWEEVTQSTYAQHQDHLGMAIYSKPEGKLADEAITVATPPGYAYVGNPRYGEWQTRNGQSFWVFYGQYALMRDLLWGAGRYSPIGRDTYGSYRDTVRSGKSWYGSQNQYGTKGSQTRTRYADSNYYKDQTRTRYSGSNYQGSGNRSAGRYSGSNYQGSGNSRAGRYSGSGYQGRSSPAPSRSSGSRTSRYRSSSFGGFGK